MTQNKKGLPPIVYILSALLIGGTSYICYQTFGRSKQATALDSNGTAAINSNSVIAPTILLKSSRGVNYNKLQEDLSKKDWKQANEDTSELLLKAFGPKSDQTGNVNIDEASTPPCEELKSVNQLWSQNSNGNLGFTAQREVLKVAKGNYKAAYNSMQWQKPAGEWLIQYQYNGHRNNFKSGYEPDYPNPDKGHLPTFERGYNFKYSFDNTLAKCGF